jgi:glucose-1-phosphate adenylyltransferase
MDVEDVIILSGDHLYHMDYLKFVQRHKDTDADITISCVPMDYSRASEMHPLIKIDNNGQVIHFNEKPRHESLSSMQVDTTVLGLSPNEAKRKPFIASMGIYVFKKRVLLKLLRWRYPTANDFGSEIIPASIKEFNVQAYLFRDYWEDIGTIKSFFDANLALTEQPPKFSFYDASKPTFTSPRYLPPTKIERCRVKDSIISHGCFLQECSVEHSVVGVRSRLESGVQLKDTMMMGADSYETEVEMSSLLAEGKVPLGVGENTRISNCIVDKNARIGCNVVIANTDGVLEAARPKEGFYIRSGITIVVKNSTIMPGTVI